jgi:hypothetical protein
VQQVHASGCATPVVASGLTSTEVCAAVFPAVGRIPTRRHMGTCSHPHTHAHARKQARQHTHTPRVRAHTQVLARASQALTLLGTADEARDCSLQHDAAGSLQHDAAGSIQHEAAALLHYDATGSLQHDAAGSLQHDAAGSLQHEAWMDDLEELEDQSVALEKLQASASVPHLVLNLHRH